MTAILLWLSFPSVVVGNLLFVVVVLFRNNRSPTETFGDDNNNNAGRSFGDDNNNNAGRQTLGNDKEKTISTSWVVAVKDNIPLKGQTKNPPGSSGGHYKKTTI